MALQAAGFLLPDNATVRGMAEVKRIKVGDSRTRRQLEKLLAEGWTIADKRTPGPLEWGYKTSYTLVRDQ